MLSVVKTEGSKRLRITADGLKAGIESGPQLPKGEKMTNDEMWKKLHVTIRSEEYYKLREVLPERGAFQHLVRRFIRALISQPTADTVTVPLKFSLLEAQKDAND